MKTRTKTIITTFIIILAVIQGPFLYYNYFILIAVPYCLTGLFISIYLLWKVIRYRSTNTLYHIVGLVIAAFIGFLTLRHSGMEYLDWKLRRETRNKIVKDVKNGVLKPNDPTKKDMCLLPGNYFPPISNDGNKISIIKKANGTFDIEFLVSSGFEYYRALVYTNDSSEINALNTSIKNGTFGNDIKLDNNWYVLYY